MPEEHTGPYLQIATLCQSVLQETAGNLSLIRITDSVQVGGPTRDMQPIPFPITAVVSFRAGFAHGKYHIKISALAPSKGEVLTAQSAAYFEGEDRGVNSVFPLNILLQEEGVYWFRVFLEDMFVTQVPLRVVYQQIVAPQLGAR
jgi:hypothetical protein